MHVTCSPPPTELKETLVFAVSATENRPSGDEVFRGLAEGQAKGGDGSSGLDYLNSHVARSGQTNRPLSATRHSSRDGSNGPVGPLDNLRITRPLEPSPWCPMSTVALRTNAGRPRKSPIFSFHTRTYLDFDRSARETEFFTHTAFDETYVRRVQFSGRE